ncbi:MAG: hypothetical protein QXR62_04545 [Candidatus Bathyarchaeia archaeon]
MPRIIERKPHPNSSEHEVVVFMTKVRHEMQVPKDAGIGEVMRLITRYLKGYDEETAEGKVHIKGYEDIYPETREEQAEA